jgi:site-specific DNA-methyltransferase (adenine-specific)
VTEAYNMDCMEYMRTLPDNAFDLAVVDPPYGDALANESGGGTGNALADGLTATEVRVTRVGGTWAEKFGKKS